MHSNALIAASIAGLVFFTGTTQAYDLPKIKPDKKISAESEDATRKGLKGDWSHVEKFEREIQAALAENENLPASSPARVMEDKNLIFIAYYKGNAYFLDRYSLKVAKNSRARRSWSQHIFPIGEGISAKNSVATTQKFNVEGGEVFNSSRRRDKISAAKTEADRIFLEECFKVGYYYAFGEDFDKIRH
ncbi:MAG: hypothetical protein J5809_06100 [Selenomonadaceae bacterium]|nr:hypothetical protein [Selenomonadaceae bacterium]